MNLNAKQKKFLILFVLSVIITFRLVAPTKAWGVTNGVINEKNGDIAYSYYSPHDTIVVLCDKEGNELFSKSIPTDGGASTYIAFFGENLGVYVSREFKKYCFNRNGEELDHTEIPVICIYQTAKGVGVSVIGKTDLTDGACALFLLQPFLDSKSSQTFPGLSICEHVHQVIIDIIGFQPR